MLSTDERRSARLLFSPELRAGTVTDADLDRDDVRAAVVHRQVPSLPARAYQRVLMKRGRLDYVEHSVAPMVAARRAVLGDAAAAPPRFLVRVDEFPHYLAADDPGRYGIAAFRRFHAILRDAGVPYLVAVVPRLAHAPLDPKATGGRELDAAELETLADLRRDGVGFATHGLDHRTRHASPRRHSELLGLDPKPLRARLDEAERVLAGHAVRPRVFVPPYNRFGFRQYDELAKRYDVVCGGPESVALMGFHPAPLWRGRAVWLPGYPPLYDRAGAVLEPARRLVAERVGLWVPVVLHWGWEADEGLTALERLAEVLAPHAASWDDFLEAVEASR